MAQAATYKPDEHPTPKVSKTTLSKVEEVLVLVGRPLYFILVFIILFTLFILFPIWQIVKSLVNKILLSAKWFLLLLHRSVTRSDPASAGAAGSDLNTSGKPKRKYKITSQKITFPKFGAGFFLKPSLFLLLPLLLLFLFWQTILRDLPSPHELTTRQPQVSTKIYDRNGILLYKIYKNQNRSPVAIEKIPQVVREATLAAEDAEFYGHFGFSVRGIVRALIKNYQNGGLSGGSTITQQLVKNVFLTPDKTIIRKIKELVLAVEVEATFPKDAILEMYLNEVSYGGTAYGIQEASKLYFGKDVENIDLAEAALLVGLTKSPTKYSPFGVNPDLAIARQKHVLNLMVVNHYITAEEAKTAEEEKLQFAPNTIDIKAPHFVMFVRELLEEKYGVDVIEKGGLEVTTTLDYSIQKMAEGVVTGEIAKLAGYKVGNGAAVILNPKTGEILAMVGSKDYFDTGSGGNVNVTTSARAPGSSIKVVNYAYALSHSFTPASILDDSPVSYSVPGSPVYTPKNYDGKYRGKLPLRNALAESRNIPAVKVLASYGVPKMIEQGRAMGITTWEDPKTFGLSLTLGGGSVKLLDLANVYATVANYGRKPEVNPILKITDYKGKVLEENPCSSAVQQCIQTQVLDARIAYQLTDILKDSPARIPAFGIHSSLTIAGHPEVAVKTGTSNELRDNLTIGFNQDYLVAVWVGNNDNSPMAKIASGITGAAPIWNKIMTNLLAKVAAKEWSVPDGVIQVSICRYTATLPCQGCPVKKEWFTKETVPTKYCSPEWFTPTPAPSSQPQIL